MVSSYLLLAVKQITLMHFWTHVKNHANDQQQSLLLFGESD